MERAVELVTTDGWLEESRGYISMKIMNTGLFRHHLPLVPFYLFTTYHSFTLLILASNSPSLGSLFSHCSCSLRIFRSAIFLFRILIRSAVRWFSWLKLSRSSGPSGVGWGEGWFCSCGIDLDLVEPAWAAVLLWRERNWFEGNLSVRDEFLFNCLSDNNDYYQYTYHRSVDPRLV